ncbi:MAG: Fic family protein [Candidatus Micrarchaeota archaeon]
MQIDALLWARITEKKGRLDRLRPFSQAALARLRESILVSLAYNSNAIEGNSLTLQETKLVIEEGLTIGGKSLREHLEAVNHKPALAAIEAEAADAGKPFSEAFVCYLHSIVLKGISERYAGRYRDQNVRISGSAFKPPPFHEVPALMAGFVAEFNEKRENAVELAAWAHFQLVHIHPFMDGNGRTARLLMDLVLLKNGYPIAIIQRAGRKQYYRVLEQAHAGNPAPFYNFVARSVESSLDMYLEALEPGRGRDEEFVSLSDAARGTPYSAEYLGLLARKGSLDAVKFGRDWKTSKKALKEYAEKIGRRKTERVH